MAVQDVAIGAQAIIYSYRYIVIKELELLDIPQANSDNTKYGKRSKQDVKSPPRYLSEFPVICFHTSMINWQKPFTCL